MRKLLFLIVFAAIAANLLAQTNSRTKDGLVMYLSADSSRYLKSTLCLQTWMRYNENNPGTTVFGQHQAAAFDIGIRRFRMQLFGKIAPHVFVYTQFGINNFNSISARKSGAFFHDMLGEYEVMPGYLSLGAGLTGWSGLSRYASPSVATFLMADAPLFQQATNDVSDQFLRKLSVYAKGKVKKFDYRMALSKPMMIQTMQGFSAADTSLSVKASINPAPPAMQGQGYFQYQFFDQESNLTPYAAGCYLGKKKVLNIGAGAIYQPDAMRQRNSDGSTAVHPMLLLAADAFLDLPLNKEKQTALTVYGGYFRYDFGNNYYRNVGVFNVANGLAATSNTASGYGDAFPMIGTGNAVYTQAGYLFPAGLMGKHGQLQVVASVFSANWQALADRVNVAEGGFNWYISGHNAKLNLNYQSRPVFVRSTDGSISEDKKARRGMTYLQYQIFF